MASPQKKVSKQKVRQRRGQVKAVLAAVVSCPACGAPVKAHCACAACGTYKGRKVLSVEEK